MGSIQYAETMASLMQRTGRTEADLTDESQAARMRCRTLTGSGDHLYPQAGDSVPNARPRNSPGPGRLPNLALRATGASGQFRFGFGWTNPATFQ